MNINNSLADPTSILSSLVTKLSFCLLFLASSILFYHMARRGSTIPPNLAFPVAVFLILMGIVQSIFATYEFSYVTRKMIKYCSNTKINCLYDIKMLEVTNIFYLILCFCFIFINLYIAYLLKQYP